MSSGKVLGFLHIALEFRNQLVRSIELDLGAQETHEFHADIVPIQVEPVVGPHAREVRSSR